MSKQHSGLVVGARSRSFTVRVGSEEILALVPKRLRFLHADLVDPVAVGDRVTLSITGDQAVIDEVEPHRNALSRPASGRAGRRQVLAANLDLAVVVLAAQEPQWKPATLDRYLVLASGGGVPGMACINKIDLNPAVRCAPELSVYPRLNVPVSFTSVVTGEGMDELDARLAGKTAVLIGPSGAGKTSLINRLVPGAERRVSEISQRTQKGRHTTTWVEMLDLANGGHLVDSPGLRVLDLTGVEPENLVTHFPEMAPLAAHCRFDDCRHMAEPDCAVKRGVEEGTVVAHRYDSYRRIYASLEAGQG
jgi:ribosome biogenesis GTPase